MWEVRLHENWASDRPIRLRELTGEDEILVADGQPSAASRLLDRLLIATPGVDGSLVAPTLSITDHDRLLAAIFMRLYGDRAECHATCARCDQTFELELPLRSVIAEQDAQAADWGEPDEAGWWTTDQGVRFRAPSSEEARQADGPTLRQRCLDGDTPIDFDLEEALATAAPILSIDLRVTCALCGAAQIARFDIATHLAKMLGREHPFLLREIHLLASGYGWSLGEILSLRRQDRRALAGLLASERDASAARRRTP